MGCTQNPTSHLEPPLSTCSDTLTIVPVLVSMEKAFEAQSKLFTNALISENIDTLIKYATPYALKTILQLNLENFNGYVWQKIFFIKNNAICTLFNSSNNTSIELVFFKKDAIWILEKAAMIPKND